MAETRREREALTRAERLEKLQQQLDAGTLRVYHADELTPEQRQRYGLTSEGDHA